MKKTDRRLIAEIIYSVIIILLNVTFGKGFPGIANEYMFQFSSGVTPTVLNLPEGVKWIGSSVVRANRTYQVSILNNIAVMGGTL